jgi:anti-repressor protein
MEDTIKTQLPQGNDLIALAVIEAQKMIAERDKQIERMKPKEIFADAVSASKGAILIGDLAKLISQNGYRIGQNRLFDWLRNNGYLIKSGSSRNRPMQRYVEQGLFEVKETAINMPNGNVRTALTTKVSGKGQQYFVNKFLQKRGENDERSAESKL